MSSDDQTAGDIAIRVSGLSKRYKLGARQPYRRVGDVITRPFRRGKRKQRNPTLWALRDVSFNVRQGEIVGIIGANGAGKTTLLRILTKITLPTEGRAEIYGRVGSLLEVGTGFHPELTGQENVFLNGAILGMGRKEIARKYDEIVEFSQIEDFMDTPVKHYSSGMRVRLAFSVAAHLEPEILFIDEVLAVGDASFQQKCLGKMEEVAGAGRTVMFVSHNMGMITGLCTRALWLKGGTMLMDATAQEVVEAYLSTGQVSEGRWEHPVDADCGDRIRIQSVEVVDEDGMTQPAVPFDEPIRIRVDVVANQRLSGAMVMMRITDSSGSPILVTSPSDVDAGGTDWEPGHHRFTCTIPGALLRPGRYTIGLQARMRRAWRLDSHNNILGFDVSPIRFTVQTQRPGVITPMLPWVRENVPAEATGT